MCFIYREYSNSGYLFKIVKGNLKFCIRLERKLRSNTIFVYFLLHCKKFDSLRKNSKFISETVHDLGKGVDTVKHIPNPQSKHNCKNVSPFIDDTLHVRKSSIKKVGIVSLLLFLYGFYKETSVFLMDTIVTCIIRILMYNGRIMSHVNWMPGLMMALISPGRHDLDQRYSCVELFWTLHQFSSIAYPTRSSSIHGHNILGYML